VYVQFSLRAGDAAVEISFGEDGQEEVIPEASSRTDVIAVEAALDPAYSARAYG